MGRVMSPGVSITMNRIVHLGQFLTVIKALGDTVSYRPLCFCKYYGKTTNCPFLWVIFF